MVNATQMTNQDPRDLQVEGLPKCSWRTTGTWCALLGYLRPCHDMANGKIFPHLIHPSGMAEPPTLLCYGLPTSTR